MQELLINNNDNFVKWFNGSMMIDDRTNKPIVFYHKSRSKIEFDEFRYHDIKKNEFNNDYGFYFTDRNSKVFVDYIGDGIDIYCYLKILNPFYIYQSADTKTIDQNGKVYEYVNFDKTFCDSIISLGFDAIIMQNIYYKQYIVFNPNQIKSTNNNGDYSVETNNMFK